MNKRKNEGITMVALTITIIILLIIASVGTFSGVNSLRQAKEETQISELKMVQQAILENYTKYKTTKNEMYLRGTQLTYSEVSDIINEINSKNTEETVTLKVQESVASDKETAYYELSEQNRKDMGITQTSYRYIVNYSTGEVINAELKNTRSGIPLYTYSVDLT